MHRFLCLIAVFIITKSDLLLFRLLFCRESSLIEHLYNCIIIILMIHWLTLPFSTTFQNIQHRKYAKWKAAYIHNCLKNGETPQPGPIGMEGEAYGRCWYYICSPRTILWLPLTKYTPDGGLSFRITEGLSPCESVVSESVNVRTLCALSKLWRTQEMTGSPSDPPPASQHRLLFM